MENDVITIAGAGPAGLSAAIVLARRGFRVRVLERSSIVGARFNDDFQGLENWSTDEDSFEELRRAGIEPTWWHHPCANGDLYDRRFRRTTVRSSRPLFYMVRRGSAHAGSLDNALRRQAESAGVEIVFRTKAEPSSVRIFAGGPRGRPVAVARGLTFPSDREDTVCAILSERLAPGGYVYFLVADGHATLATVLFRKFGASKDVLHRAVEAVERVYGLEVPEDAAEWGGYGCFTIPRSCVLERALLVGEAAGFQDALFGFGIRNAMVSGTLAALSIAEGFDYDAAWRRRLFPHLRASEINRAIYERLGIVAKGAFWSLMSRTSRGNRVLKRLYGYSRFHRVASPLAWRPFRSASRALGSLPVEGA